jgi:hypothetical protein
MKKQKMTLPELKVKSFITKLALNPDAADLLPNALTQDIKGGARSFGNGPVSCVNKQTICDCLHTEICSGTGHNHSQMRIDTLCF